MNKTFIVQSMGHTHCPEFNAYGPAKELLDQLVAESMQDCQRRFGKAVKHKLGEDSYSITVGKDRQCSALWACHYIESF